MKFEEEFPILIKNVGRPHKGNEWQMWYSIKNIQENCLDKAKVIDAIQTCVGMGHMTSEEIVFASRLRKELGLE